MRYIHGDPEPIHIEDTDTTFAIEEGAIRQYHIEGGIFVYVDGHGGPVTAISGYPTQTLAPRFYDERSRP